MQSSIDVDFDVEFDDLGSKKNSVVSFLRKKELLKYGSLLRESDIEESMGIKQSSVTFDHWQLLKLQFREIIKSEGFFVTSRGREGDLYILLPHEMPNYNEKKNKSQLRNIKQRSRSLHMIDQSLLSDEHQKKLEFEILRNAHFEIEMVKSLKQRCR